MRLIAPRRHHLNFWSIMRTRHHGFTLRELLVVVGVVVVCFVLFVATVGVKAREKMRRVNCAQHMKSLGFGFLMYSGDNGGFFPIANAPGTRNLEPLNLASIYVDGKAYSCPSASVAHTFCSNSNYRYRGSGLIDDNAAASGVTVIYDASGNHPDNQWMNALFIDGHVGGARPDGSKPTLTWPAAIPGSPDIVITGWNRND